MNSKEASQTIIGGTVAETYKLAELKMPDGKIKHVPVQLARQADGTVEWERIDEKLAAFDRRFADTTTIPASWKNPETGAIEARPHDPNETAETIKAGGKTRVNIRRILFLNLGDPKAIITQKRLDERRLELLKKQGALLSTLVHLAETIGGDWEAAAAFIHPDYRIPK